MTSILSSLFFGPLSVQSISSVHVAPAPSVHYAPSLESQRWRIYLLFFWDIRIR